MGVAGSFQRNLRPDGDETAASDDDAALVALAKHNRQAFATLYDRYADPVYRYCYRRLGSREAAEDATSLVFTKALAAIAGLQRGSFRNWLFTIAHHVIADDLRGRRADRPLDTAVALPDIAPTPEEAALSADDRRSLRALLSHLPPAERSVVELRLAGLDGAEIGAILGRSRSAVDTAQFRAVSRLRSLLGIHASTKEEPNADR